MGTFVAVFFVAICAIFIFKKITKKPSFEQCKTVMERAEWLCCQSGWENIDKNVIDAVINKFKMDDLLVVFVAASKMVKLTDTIYVNIHSDDEQAICRGLSIYLAMQGGIATEMMQTCDIRSDEFKSYYQLADDSLESAVFLDNENSLAFYHYAKMKTIVGKNEEALKLIRQGQNCLEKYLELYRVVMSLSVNDVFKNTIAMGMAASSEGTSFRIENLFWEFESLEDDVWANLNSH